MPEKVSFAAFFGPNRNDMTNRANWGLKEYRKYDPQALSDDPELYARIVSNKKLFKSKSITTKHGCRL